MYGQMGVDWQERVDFLRLRKERLGRIREQMRKNNLGALVALRNCNIRYMTGARPPDWPEEFSRYSVLAGDAEPVLFELGGDVGRAIECMPWLKGRIHPAIPIAAEATGSAEVEKWIYDLKRVLKESGVEGEEVGVDKINLTLYSALHKANINIVDASSAMSDAVAIKTKDELELLRIACSLADAAFDTLKRNLKPGIRECDLFGLMANSLYLMGSERFQGIVASRTNPYYRTVTDKAVGVGEFLASDIFHSFMGYHTCVTRTFLCGSKPTREQKELYRECYDSLYGAIRAVKPGVTTLDVARKLPEEGYDRYSLNIGHGVGLDLHEPPAIWRMISERNPVEIKPNMYIALETYAGKPGGQQGVRLEECLAVTDTGYEIYSHYPFEEELLQ